MDVFCRGHNRRAGEASVCQEKTFIVPRRAYGCQCNSFRAERDASCCLEVLSEQKGADRPIVFLL